MAQNWIALSRLYLVHLLDDVEAGRGCAVWQATRRDVEIGPLHVRAYEADAFAELESELLEAALQRRCAAIPLNPQKPPTTLVDLINESPEILPAQT